MDCFFAAIEVRERPELRGRPVAVGGRSRRGVLTTCNYQARKFGCRSAMPVFKALQLCPDLVLLPVRFELYRRESWRIQEILKTYTTLVEPLSLDEAFIDVSDSPRKAIEIACEMRMRILDATGLTASVGIAPNKMLAKIGSDWRKPDGIFEIEAESVVEFLRDLPVDRIWGVGPRNALRLKNLGVATCGQLQEFGRAQLEGEFGRFGAELYRLCRGVDHRPVEPHRERKSYSTERTFAVNLKDLEACQRELNVLIRDVEEGLGRSQPKHALRKIFVKVKFADFRQTTVETISDRLDSARYRELLREGLSRSDQAVRLLGVGVRFAESRDADDAGQMEFGFA